MDRLDVSLSQYQALIDGLGTAAGSDSAKKERLTAPAIMQVLLAREALARLIPQTEPLDPHAFALLSKLDGKLKESARLIERAVGRDALVAWRETAQAPSSAWWWYLDTLAGEESDRRYFPLIILSALVLAVAISLGADIARRFLVQGPDFLGSFSTLFQLGLTLVAGRALVSAEAGGLGFLSRYSFVRRLQTRHVGKLVLSLLVFLLIAGIDLLLPSLARYYNDQGVATYRDGNISSAIGDFKRAISLSPDFAQAHYNLGDAYEDAQSYDDAQSEYKTAILADPHFYEPLSNLARLYIVRNNDYAGALALVNRALNDPTASIPDITLSTLYRNRGWAELGLNDLVSAERDVRHALSLQPAPGQAGGANLYSGHCLLAQILEKEQSTPSSHAEAQREWCQCFSLAQGVISSPEAGWVATARERNPDCSTGSVTGGQ